MKRDRKDYLTCRICRKPVLLGADTATDENGKSVHDDCQVKRIIGKRRTRHLLSTPHYLSKASIQGLAVEIRRGC